MVSFGLWFVMIAAHGVLGQHSQDGFGWKEFKSAESHFRVLYPSSWRVLQQNAKGLDIVNFPEGQGQHGVVLSPTGASIQVSGPPAWIPTMEEWAVAERQGEPAIEDGVIRVAHAPIDACATLRRITWQQDTDGMGGHVMSYTGYYCLVGGRVFGVLVTNWKGDPKQPELQEVALKIAESLRTW